MQADRASNLVNDLLSVQIDTIIKDGMTARRMPPVPMALLDIIGKYYRFLFDLAHAHLPGEAPSTQGDGQGRAAETAPRSHLLTLMAPAAPRPAKCLDGQGPPSATDAQAPGLPSRRRNGVASFDALRAGSQYLLDNPHLLAPVPAGDRVIVERIYRQCCAMPALLRRLDAAADRIGVGKTLIKRMETAATPAPDEPPMDSIWNADRATLAKFENDLIRLDYDPHDVAIVRKIWEVGTEKVAMQTVVHLDGDIITRVASGYEGERWSALHALHTKGIETGITTWFKVAELVRELVAGTLQAIGRLIFRTPVGLGGAKTND